jgi:hypothetical protein
MSPRKAIKTSLIIALVSGFVSLSPLIAPVPRAEEASQQPGVSEDAAAALARMGKTLQAKEFSFVSRTLRAYAGPNGELLHIAHTTKTIFRRPDRLLVDVTGDDGSIKMLYDGKTFVLYAVEQKKYASVAISGDIDSALDEIQDRTGTDFPLADFLSTDPAKSLLSGVTAGGQVGTATIGGVPCRHFFFMQAPDMELEFWLEDNERSLPRRLIVTYLSLPGRPNFIAELSDWKLSIQTPDSEFEFRPPAGVSQVELASKAEHAPSPPK